ncbi:hypothetical protein V2J09_000445 [Rumex salicifolius]
MDPVCCSLLEDPAYHLTINDINGFDFPVELSKQSTSSNKRGGATSEDPKMDGGDGKRRKKGLHKEVERQRRQEMTCLHRSLRSLLPAEYLMGKRSMSDHLSETVKYIKHLNAKTEELRAERDELKGGRTDEVGPQCQVVLKPGRDGVMEVLVADSRPSSAVVKALLQQGLDVISCFSTHITHNHNNKWLHCVQAQVGEGTNVSEAQENLTKEIPSEGKDLLEPEEAELCTSVESETLVWISALTVVEVSLLLLFENLDKDLATAPYAHEIFLFPCLADPRFTAKPSDFRSPAPQPHGLAVAGAARRVEKATCSSVLSQKLEVPRHSFHVVDRTFQYRGSSSTSHFPLLIRSDGKVGQMPNGGFNHCYNIVRS